MFPRKCKIRAKAKMARAERPKGKDIFFFTNTNCCDVFLWPPKNCHLSYAKYMPECHASAWGCCCAVRDLGGSHPPSPPLFPGGGQNLVALAAGWISRFRCHGNLPPALKARARYNEVVPGTV